MILDEVKAVMPSFVTRVERPDRGGEWIELSARSARRPASGGRSGSASRSRATADRGPSVAADPSRRRRGRPAGGAAVRVERGLRGRVRDAAVGELDADERAELLGDLVGDAREPPPPAGPRLRGAALPLRDRLGLRRVPRPAAPPDADAPVADADARPRRRRARAGRARRLRRRLPPRARGLARASTTGWRAPACPTRRPTRCASATGSATSSTSTPARRCS